MITFCKLPLRFDPQRLRADCDRVRHRFQTYTRLHAERDGAKWEGIPLVSVGGDTGPKGLLMGKKYEKTPLLDDCPYIAEVLKALHCESSARVRILGLKPGGVIPTHTDRHSSYYLGVLCLHVPIATHPDVRFVINGKPVHMRAGELWYIDNSYPHSVYNHSPIERTHLVIDDCLLDSYLRSLFPAEIDRLYTYRHRYAQARYWLKSFSMWHLKELIQGR